MFYLIIFLFAVFIGFILFSTYSQKSKQVNHHVNTIIDVRKGFEDRLSKALQIKTISYEEESDISTNEFVKFIAFVKTQFPLIDLHLEKFLINEYSLIIKATGEKKEEPPAVWLAHYDVVPAEEETIQQWIHGPFEGKVENGIIYGRGTLDNKSNMFAMLEAVEMQIKSGKKFERDLYLCFGHDEEKGGRNGAAKIAEWLEKNNVKAAYVLDEGMCITEGIVPNIVKPVALIGIAEKGYASFELCVNFKSGHASMPSDESANRILALAISKFHSRSFPPVLNPSLKHFMSHLGPELPFVQRMAFANQWLFKRIVFSAYQKTSSGNASIRTTIATTIMQGGERDNVVPSQAKAVVNCRILPGQTIQSTKTKIKKIIKDERVQVNDYGHSNEPPEVSSVSAAAYKTLEKSIKLIFPEVIVCPAMAVAGTDSKHYQKISANIYRFFPAILNRDDLSSIHGINEKISVEAYSKMIRFYCSLLSF